ncbi:hypothetical protein BJF83_22880 [Nocardiopsis sp. CNR-923]|nr:hypothetical protein BJF83_22880 [Nocardiopsis sp. CNR-923]
MRRALTDLYGAPYDLRVGGIRRSWHPPALAWRTDVFTLDAWSGPVTDQHLYTHNSGWLSWVHAPGRTVLRVQVAHLDYVSPAQRVIEAETLRAQITPDLDHLLLVDGNEIPSGSQFGDRDWAQVPLHKRRTVLASSSPTPSLASTPIGPRCPTPSIPGAAPGTRTRTGACTSMPR